MMISSGTESKSAATSLKAPPGDPGDPRRDRILKCQRIQQRIHTKLASTILGMESGGDNDLSVDSEAESGEEEEEEEGGEAGAFTYMMMRRLQVLLFLLLLPVVVETALNYVLGLDIRGADEASVPLLPPSILQTQQSSGEQVAGSAVPQQLFAPQPSWPQQPPMQQEMVQPPIQQRVAQPPNQPQLVQRVVQPSVAPQPKLKKAK
jgi:hypothetical protein